MCKLLNFNYEWKRNQLVSDAGFNYISPIYNCTSEEKSHLENHCLQYSNTHLSFENLIDGTVELIITARDMSLDERTYADEKGVALIEKPIAKDALSFIVNPLNPVDELTSQQIRSIYTGVITNWNEIGGNDTIISPYIRNRNSGSQVKFEQIVMGGMEIMDLPEMREGITMFSPYRQIDEDVTGIAFTPYYYYSVIINDGKTKAIGVDSVPMRKDNIANGAYPFVTDVYAAVRFDTDKESMPYKVFEYLTTVDGQAAIEESGYVTLAEFTGIKTINDKATKGKIYTLDGRKVESTDHLPKGFYIQNGKKYIAK